MNKQDLPMWDGKSLLHTERPFFNVDVYDEVQYESAYKVRTKVGWVYSPIKSRKKAARRLSGRLHKEGYTFRRGPVPGVHKYNNSIHQKHSAGLKKEFCDNESCNSNYREYNLVRSKRGLIPIAAMDWDFYDRHEPILRSWKRSKKRKQYL